MQLYFVQKRLFKDELYLFFSQNDGLEYLKWTII